MYIALLYSPFSKQEDEKGFITTSAGGGGELGSPESLPELDRPPLRKIDQYIRPDCPCCNMTKRYTVAILASIGNRFNFKLRFESMLVDELSCSTNLQLAFLISTFWEAASQLLREYSRRALLYYRRAAILIRLLLLLLVSSSGSYFSENKRGKMCWWFIPIRPRWKQKNNTGSEYMYNKTMTSLLLILETKGYLCGIYYAHNLNML